MADDPVDGHPLVLESVHKGFGRGASRTAALRGLDVTVRLGTITGVLGPDGAGKTTLMRLSAGLLLPDAGRVRVFGRDTRGAADIQQGIGYMPQRFGLYEDLTVQENLDLYADLQGLPATARQQRFAELLRLTALGPFGRRRAGALSGGMKQKLGLACALLRAPRLLLLDEPTVGVDPISRRELWSIIRGLREQQVTVLVSTAYLDEAELCDDVLLLHQGELRAQRPPAEFGAAMTGRCFVVRADGVSRRQLQARLHGRDGVVDALVQSEGVRVVIDAVAPPRVDGEDWAPAPPRFEDAFVAMLRGEAPQERRAAAVPVDPPVHAGGDEAPVIVVESLRRTFGDFVAVKDVTFSVRRGEVFGLLGANGAGKSTTFRMLCGLLPPTAGTLRVAGADLGRGRAAARARIGYVSQRFALYDNLSVAQNLAFFAATYGLDRRRRAQRQAWALDGFDLSSYADANCSALPLGFKQRLALACALLHEPSILFLDEPTSGVDPLARREFWQRINGLAEAGVTVMVTTHFMEEAEYCDRLVLMSLGEILAYGSPVEIRASARTPDLPDPTMDDAFVGLIQAHEAQLRRAA